MKKRIVMALALAGLIGAAVVHKIKPEEVMTVPAKEITDLAAALSQLPVDIEIIEVDVSPLVAKDSDVKPEACIRPELPMMDESVKKEALQGQDDDLLLDVKDMEHKEAPATLSVEEKVSDMEPVKIIPEVTQSVEATPLPPMQASPAMQNLKQDAVGRFGGGRFK